MTKFLQKISFLAIMLMVGVSNVWAGSRTVDIISELSLSKTETLGSTALQVPNTPISVTGTKGTSNFPVFNCNTTSGTDLRFYKGTSCSVTFTASNTKITKIEFLKNATTASPLSDITADCGTLSGNIWTGNAESVTFLYNNSSTNFTTQIYIINITYTTSDDDPILQSIYVDGTPSKLAYNIGEDFDFTGLKVMGKYDKGDDKEITGATFSADPDVMLENTTQVAVTATYGAYTSAAKTFDVTINPDTRTSYYRVNDASTLKAGDIIVLGCSSNNVAAGQLGTNTYLGFVAATFEDDVMKSDQAIEFTLGGSAGAWTLTSTEGQIGAIEVKKLSVDDSNTKYEGTWTISISDGTASIESTNDSYGTVKYNASSPRFTTYDASGQTAIQIYRKEKPITITEAGWATACVPFKATVSGATAYYVQFDGTYLVKSEANVIPAGAGVLLKGTEGSATTATFTASAADEDSNAETDNKMIGSIAGETFSTANTKYYILANDATYGIGFYYQGEDGDGSSVICAAGKAVLAVPTSAGAKEFLPLDEATCIDKVEVNGQQSTVNGIFNLAGQKVGADYKGIVIVNGKKYLNR